MSKFRITRRGFIGSSAGAAALGLSACAGGTSVGGGPPGLPSVSGSTPTPGATAGSGSTPLPGATATAGATATPTAGPSATATPGSSSPAYNFPSASVSTGTRGPNSLPDSTRPAGQADTTLPFDTVVIVMMENHSFDNYFGMLPLRGQPLADGFTFDSNGVPLNKNPIDGGYQHAFHLKGTCQPNGVTQSWDATRKQIGTGGMDGFAATDGEAMGYWDESDIPFYYSLAKTFCVGNRAFCSATSQTYPNRRYLYSGTSSGLNQTSTATFSLPAPANGTLMDMMTKYNVSWKSYFSDLPALSIIPQTLENHAANFTPVAQFLTDAKLGQLPNVCFVDPEFGAVDDVGGDLAGYLNSVPGLPASVSAGLSMANSQGGDEENPQDIAIGEAFVAQIINAAMASPQWKSMLIIWTYDEHGGYYDHVPPAAAVLPDAIPPTLAAGDTPGQFNITGVRIPTVVASPFSKPNAVSNVPHDHTSIIATIAAKWNLPALTYRDARAATLFDYLNLNAPPAFATPPTLAAAALPAAATNSCSGTPQTPVITPNVVPRRKLIFR